MAKNDPQHMNVSKTSSQSNAKGSLAQTTKGAAKSGSFELMTPSGLAGSGFSGINKRSNDSASKAVGSGGGASNQSSQSSVGRQRPRVDVRIPAAKILES